VLNDVEVGSTIYRHVVDHSTAAKKDRLLLNLRVRRQPRNLPPMRYLVLSPFPPATATMLTRLGQRRTSSNSIRNLDSLPPHRYWISSPAGQPPTERREPRLCQVGQPPRVPADRSECGHLDAVPRYAVRCREAGVLGTTQRVVPRRPREWRCSTCRSGPGAACPDGSKPSGMARSRVQ
jgi:hypothetical protein